MAESIYLDTNVFILAFEGEPDAAEALRPLFLALQRHPEIAVTSELTLAEVLVRPERQNDTRLKRIYLDLLIWSKVVALRPVSREILIESTRYRAIAHPEKPGPEENRRNFLPDAIHVVTASSCGCRSFVARDTRLRLPAGMTRVEPDRRGVEALLEELK
ncbi:MAG: type II toxin-antitoxin system VapC family toxin [Variibacter sp.]|nr:type II toxin-antitoxin system VapC family toxin [Variibacter sp.]